MQYSFTALLASLYVKLNILSVWDLPASRDGGKKGLKVRKP